MSNSMRALLGRGDECAVLDGLIEEVRGGRSAVLVVSGEAGVGKSALLHYAVESAVGFEVVRAAGVESEMELAFSAVHQLCAPMLDRLELLPEPQRDAIAIAFALTDGPPPDLFLVGLAVLSLLSAAAEDGPLLCVIDDAQWLDRASAQTLTFVARRVLADSIGMLFAAREPDVTFRNLPELAVGGLPEKAAGELLAQVVRGPLDRRIQDRIVAETRGNPLALLELPRDLSPTQLAGGFGLPEALPDALLAGRIEDSFLRRVAELPASSQVLLLVAAAEPTGDPVLVWRAAALLGLGMDAAHEAEAAGLIDLGGRVRFRHPLVRSAVYRAASADDRRRVHSGLADATDAELDPDRRAWHRAQSIEAPDEEVAAELERSAGRAQARGGLAAAAAFLERSAALTVDPSRRAERALAAAQAAYQAGAPEQAFELLARAEAGPSDDLTRARASLLRGQMAFASGHSADASSLLLATARRFEQVAPKLARETYLDALAAATFVGRLAKLAGLPEIAAAARTAPADSGRTRAPDLLLDGLSLLITDGYPAGAPVLTQAVSAFRRGDVAAEDELRWFFVACHSAHDLWEDESWHELSARYLELARNLGALGVLPIALAQRVGLHLHAGEFSAAAALVEETSAIAEATGNDLPAYSAMALAGWQGRTAEAVPLIEAIKRHAISRDEGMGLSIAHYTSAVLFNGLGRYQEAVAAADLACAYPQELGFANWGLVELVEACARSGDNQRAADAVERLVRTTDPCDTPWARGVEARARALITEGDDAEALYREAIDQLGRCRAVVALARAHLVYGEWLRRRGRRVDARSQLRAAHDVFVSAGAEAFAERTRRELVATGETVRKRFPGVGARELTAQEAHIARLARDGSSNAEIGAELFLSVRTVEWHLRNVFGKLGVSSRRALRGALPGADGMSLSAGARSRTASR
ncbi:helix-turn-helix transcriptional regulator [Kribbella sp. CA-247076]|uniref:helix-turn-helix transcriptional regulator n=1 Tax=Kribbella sp. CA-247076 TaxID=3239941 RepID=UPI003D8CA147